MITINDNDMPIEVANKIINGTKVYECGDAMKKLREGLSKAFGYDDDGTMDMFSLEELREIALYLLVYCQMHEEDGD